MSRSAFLLVGLTAIVGAMAAVVTFALLRVFSAAKAMASGKNEAGAETALMTAALEQALRDLRARERAMAARAEASERLGDQILESLTSGLLVVDADGVVQALNPAGRRLLGLSDAALATDLAGVLQHTPALIKVVGGCLQTGAPIRRSVVPLDAADGRPTHLGVTVSPLAAAPGKTSGAICLFTDLSDIVGLEEQLRLKDSLAEVGELTAGIAHEFRNGLATIHGYARLIDLDHMPEDMRKFVAGIRDETETLGAVVRNFLNFARPAELVLGDADVAVIVERAADDIRGEAIARGGTVTIRGAFARVPGDDVLLRQAFSNLCRNALEACTEAAIVPAIVLEGARDPAQHVLRISVIDNGPGIERSVARTLFRPFVTTRARGTGLGLALVQKIVVNHNGRVITQAEPGGGTRFTVTLPLLTAS